MPRRLVALSSSAIAAIYLAGFVYTRGADAGLASAATSVPTTATASPSPTASVSQPAAVVSASATTTPTSTSTSTVPTGAYRDGTYTGSGTSRRGDVSVALTIQSGRIANVTINSVTTQYPVSRIASLPAQVISRQNGQVDSVSGATYSAQAFRLAVQAALGQASA